MAGILNVVVGAQYGSEAKGAVAATLSARAPKDRPHVAVRVAGPNAGHTVIGPKRTGRLQNPDGKQLGEFLDGQWGDREWKLRSVPVAAVSRPDAVLVIAAGSEVDLEVLRAEVDELDAAGYRVSGRLLVDAQATLLTSVHRAQEGQAALTARLGSTAKGIGAARADRIWRTAQTVASVADKVPGLVHHDTASYIRQQMAEHDATVVVEGTQGFGLGLHAGEYPYCTSSDCRAVDFLAMVGLSPWDPAIAEFGVYVVARTRPIRVAGNSGRLQNETSWAELGLPEERTTVTNKIRRVGEWDPELVRRALEANGGPGPNVRLVVTMLDQVFPEAAECTTLADLLEVDGVADWIAEREREVGPIFAVGVNPERQIVIGDPIDSLLESLRVSR